MINTIDSTKPGQARRLHLIPNSGDQKPFELYTAYPDVPPPTRESGVNVVVSGSSTLTIGAAT